MNATTRNLALLAVSLTGLGAVWFAVVRGETAPPLPSAGAAPLGLQWRAGNEQQYLLAVDATVRIGGDTGHAPPMRQLLRGTLGCRTLAVEPAGALVDMRLSPAELLVDGATDTAATETLTRPFRVAFAPDGTITRCEFSGDTAVAHRRLLEEAVRTFQVVWRDAPAWSTEEQHATGRYAARYERLGDGHGRRRKLHYLGGDGPGRRIAVLGANAEWTLAPATDWLAGMTVDERLVTHDDTGIDVEVTTHATLAPAGAAAPAVAAAAWDFAAAAEHATEAATGRAGAFTDRSPEQLAADVAELLAALDAAGEGRAVWIHRLRDLLRADDRVAELLLARMQSVALRDRTRADTFLALELSGTAAAQRALVRVADDGTWSHSDRSRALIALGGVERADAATVAALWARSRARNGPEAADLANTAMLSLGALAGRAAAEDGAAGSVRGGLLSEAWGAADSGQRAVAVLALANTGDRSLTPELLPLLEDRASDVRRAAAKALGKLGDAATAVHLALRLPLEADSAVRANLATALAGQTAPPAEVLTLARGSIATEADEATRLQLARVLTRDLAAHAENVETLRAVLAHETSDRVRRCIGEALGKFEQARR